MENLTLKKLPAEERPRERLIRYGEDSLSNAELLGIIIKDGTRDYTAIDLAHQLIHEFGNLRSVSQASVTELCKIKGIGPAKAATIKAVFSLARRFATEPLKNKGKFTCSADIFEHFHNRVRNLKKETAFVVLLDSKNRVINEIKISEGSLTASIVHPREVFSPAIKESAAAIVFVHNHPSGDPTPSAEDMEVTRRLIETGKIIGIKILDHIIIGDQTYVSFVDKGLM